MGKVSIKKLDSQELEGSAIRLRKSKKIRIRGEDW